jgi:AcrR family transcriptional regulator
VQRTLLEKAETRPAVKRHAGRPRSLRSRAAILRCAYAALRDQPVAEITMLDIARRAQVSTATVYRWWKTREALLLDAVLEKMEKDLVLRNDGSPLDRLRDYTLQVGRLFTSTRGIVTARLLSAIQDNAALRGEFFERILVPRETEAEAVVREAIARHQLPPGLEIGAFIDAVVGPLLSRLLLHRERIDEPYVLAVFERAVAGAGAGQKRARRG